MKPSDRIYPDAEEALSSKFPHERHPNDGAVALEITAAIIRHLDEEHAANGQLWLVSIDIGARPRWCMVVRARTESQAIDAAADGYQRECERIAIKPRGATMQAKPLELGRVFRS